MTASTKYCKKTTYEGNGLWVVGCEYCLNKSKDLYYYIDVLLSTGAKMKKTILLLAIVGILATITFAYPVNYNQAKAVCYDGTTWSSTMNKYFAEPCQTTETWRAIAEKYCAGKCVQTPVKKCGINSFSVTGICTPLSCRNGIKDVAEQDIDCGGVCIPCATVKESVKCTFLDTKTSQECYSEKGKCKAEPREDGTGRTYATCYVEGITGKPGEKITWTSTCGGYAYETLDGRADVLEFKCSGEEPFCGKSTNGACKTNNDCMTGGCSGQICQSKNEAPVITTCEYRECFSAKKYGLTCGCVNGQCNWNKETSPICGNNIIEPGEECDGINFGTVKRCTDLGFTGGTLKCSKDCRLDTSACTSSSQGTECKNKGGYCTHFTDECIEGYVSGSPMDCPLGKSAMCCLPAQKCLGEGQTGNWLTKEECCAGLNKIRTHIFPDDSGKCVTRQDTPFICTSKAKCGDGTCSSLENQCSCPKDCSTTSICKDSDGGKNFYTKGYTGGISPSTNEYYEGEDVCYKESATLIEHYCDGKYHTNMRYACPNGCKDGACVKETETEKITMHSIENDGKNVVVGYSKNFDTCVHLLDASTKKILHKQNVYCKKGEKIKVTQPLEIVWAKAGQKVKLCHGNNYNICSEVMIVEDSIAQCTAKCDKGPAVCGADGKTYSSECHAKCAGTKPVFKGTCAYRDSVKKMMNDLEAQLAKLKALFYP